ncbi:MAG: cobalamin-dependent protein [Gammaproteobacteria bacterium]|jgi:methanogenic corrinoid protein MtbC1
MTETNPLAAEILETSAAGYASAANIVLQSRQQRTPEGLDSAEWKTHLKQRILELATAVRVNEPGLFARRVNWLRRAVRARGAEESDLRAALESIRTALDQELPDNLRGAIAAPMSLALAAFESEVEPEAAALDTSTADGRLGLEYLAACLEARTEEAIASIVDAIGDDLSPAEAYANVLLPAQREIGQLWHLGDVSISEERLVTETTRTAMTLIVNQFAPPIEKGHTVLAASVAGNAHDIGLRALSHLFRLAGWKTIFLGANVPSNEIAHAAQAFEADLLLLSATLTTQISTLGDAISRIREVAGETRILIGGLALEDTPELWSQLGADAYAPDVRSAVEVGEKLLSDA